MRTSAPSCFLAVFSNVYKGLVAESTGHGLMYRWPKGKGGHRRMTWGCSGSKLAAQCRQLKYTVGMRIMKHFIIIKVCIKGCAGGLIGSLWKAHSSTDVSGDGMLQCCTVRLQLLGSLGDAVQHKVALLEAVLPGQSRER